MKEAKKDKRANKEKVVSHKSREYRTLRKATSIMSNATENSTKRVH